jgi:hypothetical protein
LNFAARPWQTKVTVLGESGITSRRSSSIKPQRSRIFVFLPCPKRIEWNGIGRSLIYTDGMLCVFDESRRCRVLRIIQMQIS